MAASESAPPAAAPVTKENVMPITSKITELSESSQELLDRMQNLKQDLQSWRSTLDNQVKVYRDELSELKISLGQETEKLRSDFQELKTTLQKQQDDVTTSLKGLTLQDSPAIAKEAEDTEVEKEEEGAEDTEVEKEETKDDMPKDENGEVVEN